MKIICDCGNESHIEYLTQENGNIVSSIDTDCIDVDNDDNGTFILCKKCNIKNYLIRVY